MPGSALRPDFPYSYRTLTVNAGTYVKREVQISGEKIIYASPTNGQEIGIRLESSDQDAIPLRPNGEIVAPYSKFFLDGTVVNAITLLVAAPATIQLTGRDVAISGNVNAALIQDFQKVLLDTNVLFSIGTNFVLTALSAGAQLKNPVGSGKILTLLTASIYSSVATSWFIGRVDTDLTTLLAGVNRDLGGSAPVGQYRHQTSIGVPNPLTEISGLVAGDSKQVPLYHDINPGVGVQIGLSNAITGNLFIALTWTERNQ